MAVRQGEERDMFKLSVISDEVSQDLGVVAKFAQKFSLDGVEVRNLWGKPPQDLLEESGIIRAVLLRYGLRVSAIASPFLKATLHNMPEYEKHMSIDRKSVV